MQATHAPALPHVPVTEIQALALGWTPYGLRTALRDGRLRRPCAGVYVDSRVPWDTHLRAQALKTVVPGHAVVCDRTAAWLHGIDVFGHGDGDLVMPIELCSLRGTRATRRRGVDGRTRDLSPVDLMDLGGVTVTTPLRTALDLGCGLTRLRALAAIDAIRSHHGVSVAELEQGLQRFRRRRGVIQLRQLVPLSDPRAESPRESATRLLIHDAGLPVPQLQWWIEVDGAPTYRLDLAYPRLRIAIEYDGRDFHRSLTQQQHDRDRRAWLREQGWSVVVVDAESLFSADPSNWLHRLREQLVSRTTRLRWARQAA